VLVPTERLWTKINDSIGAKRNRLETDFCDFPNPSVAAFASLLDVGVFRGNAELKTDAPVGFCGENRSGAEKVR
jgi:hypothetical protein